MDLAETRERIIYEKQGTIAKITLNWPEKANAQDQKLVEEVDAALADAQSAHAQLATSVEHEKAQEADIAKLRQQTCQLQHRCHPTRKPHRELQNLIRTRHVRLKG